MIKSLTAVASLTLAVSPLTALTVTNATPIEIGDGVETTSTINVTGSGTISGLTLTLNGLSYTNADGLIFGLLNERLGLGFVFVSGAGGSTAVNDVNVTFSDAAASTLPESSVGGAIISGTYLPSNFGGYEFSFYNNALAFAGFNGLRGNGDWTLYVDDFEASDIGTIAGGWSLDFTTIAVPEPATWALMLGGFGLVGAAMRRRATQARATA